MPTLDHRLPQRNRIKKQNHFQLFFKRAKAVDSYYFRLYYAPRYLEHTAVAFVANKKTGHSPHRNLCKRRLREIYRVIQHDIDGRYDLVWVAKRSMIKAPFSEIQKVVLGILKKEQLCQL